MLLAESPEVLAELEAIEKKQQLDNQKKDENESADELDRSVDLVVAKVPVPNTAFSVSKPPQAKNKHPSQIFEDFVMVLIITSTIVLAIDNPLLDPAETFVRVLGKIDIAYTCLFFLEAMIKIIAKGFFHNNIKPVQAYVKSSWNILDIFVVTVSMIDLAFVVMEIDMQQLSALKALRALRGLRPLRMISRNEGMRLVVNALFASFPAMTNVLLVCSLFILIFSIMGVSFFKGAFFRCLPEDGIDISKIDTKKHCIDAGGEWRNANAHFDDTFSAMLNLFQMTTTEGWVDVMYNGIDAVGIDM